MTAARLRHILALTVFALVSSVALMARAHKPSDSYLTLTISGDRVEGRWDIALRDLDHAYGLDTDGNGSITWGEVRARNVEIAGQVLSRLGLHANGTVCPTKLQAPDELVRHSDGTYAVVHFTAACSAKIGVIEVDYSLFFDVDPQHRGLVRFDANGATRATAFSTDHRHESFDLGQMSRWRPFVSMVKQGIVHIAEGIDHLLFLVALLLPSVVRRQGSEWVPVAGFRPAFGDVLKIVTAFTVAHSITLSLAALHVVSLPSRFIESAIAASVVLAALNNVRPVMGHDRWLAAFALGLLHGFGFSSALVDLGLPREGLVLSLLGFNLGVEMGQFAVVAVFLPLAYLARSSRAYRRFALTGGSLVIAAIACVWLVERAFAVKIF